MGKKTCPPWPACLRSPFRKVTVFLPSCQHHRLVWPPEPVANRKSLLILVFPNDAEEFSIFPLSSWPHFLCVQLHSVALNLFKNYKLGQLAPLKSILLGPTAPHVKLTLWWIHPKLSGCVDFQLMKSLYTHSEQFIMGDTCSYSSWLMFLLHMLKNRGYVHICLLLHPHIHQHWCGVRCTDRWRSRGTWWFEEETVEAVTKQTISSGFILSASCEKQG